MRRRLLDGMLDRAESVVEVRVGASAGRYNEIERQRGDRWRTMKRLLALLAVLASAPAHAQDFDPRDPVTGNGLLAICGLDDPVSRTACGLTFGAWTTCSRRCRCMARSGRSNAHLIRQHLIRSVTFSLPI